MKIAAGHTNEAKPLISIYVDYQNARLSLQQGKLLLEFANAVGRFGCKNVYHNSNCQNQNNACKLDSIGFKCLDVPCPLKNSADNQLIADCIKDVNNNLSPDIVILVSGDGDFAGLVVNLHKLGKKVIIFAQAGNVKQRLKEIADEFHFLGELPELVKDKTQPQTTSVHRITYNDAIECLLETVNIALNQGKLTRFSSIDQLMRKLFPNYQGASSILKKDGATFSGFGKFIDAVVADGKVCVQSKGKLQELFLIKKNRQTA